MPDHTHGQLIDAWDAIDRMETGHITQAAYNEDLEFVKAVLPERPAQTMHEIGWDQDKHFLWEADHNGDVFAMLGYSYEDYKILTNKGHISPRDLIPTGRRYKLILDDGHPEYLETLQDYEDAPNGTIVTDLTDGIPWLKDRGAWSSPFMEDYANQELAGERRRVLRWGWA